MRSTPHGDGYSVGQLAQQWERSHYFVSGLINRDLLTPDEHGVITNAELGRFYREHGELLNA